MKRFGKIINNYYEVETKASRKFGRVNIARHMFCLIMSKMRFKHKDISKYLGYRSISSVSLGIKSIRNDISANKKLSDDYDFLYSKALELYLSNEEVTANGVVSFIDIYNIATDSVDFKDFIFKIGLQTMNMPKVIYLEKDDNL